MTRHGTVIGPAMTSLVGYPELTTSKGAWCGNDVWREVLPPAQTHAARAVSYTHLIMNYLVTQHG